MAHRVKCHECKKDFVTYRDPKATRYCSRKCHHKSRKAKEDEIPRKNPRQVKDDQYLDQVIARIHAIAERTS